MSALLSGLSPATTARLAGFAAGVAAAAVVYIDMQRLVWRGAAETARVYGTLQPLKRENEQFFGPRTRALVVRGWNGAIDRSVGALATELAKRGL